jgi:hypothetical protein
LLHHYLPSNNLWDAGKSKQCVERLPFSKAVPVMARTFVIIKTMPLAITSFLASHCCCLKMGINNAVRMIDCSGLMFPALVIRLARHFWCAIPSVSWLISDM